jgi:glycosyltransferase involved in cell wall biosynthesis
MDTLVRSDREAGGEEDSRPCVVMLWYELTPYQINALKRIQTELSSVRWIHVFTHSISSSSMPWQMQLPDGVDIRFDERHRIPNDAVLYRGFLGMFRFMSSIIDSHKPMIVLTAGHQDVARWMLIPFLKFRGIPYVLWSDSNVFGLNRGRPVKDALRRIYLRAILRGFDAFMPMGTCGKAYYRLLGPKGRPMFLRPYEPDYGLVSRRDEVAERELSMKLRFTPNRRRFLYSGRLVSWKRVDLLIRAYSSVAESMPDWDLLIAGGGPDQAHLQQMVPHALRDRVTFSGFLQMPELRCCYHLSDVLVHPSEFEPWALVINEAAAAGMAMIATDVTGAAVELVRNNVNGYLVPPGNAEALADAMAKFGDVARLDRFRSASAHILAEWRTSADPVDGLRSLVTHFRDDRRQATKVTGVGM